MLTFVEGSVPAVSAAHISQHYGAASFTANVIICVFVCLPVCRSVWIYKTAMLFRQENICFADRNQKTSKKFCLTWRKMLLEVMESVEMFISFNANKIHQGVRYFYELLNTWVHNICRTFLFARFSLVCRINERWTDLVHSTETLCYLSTVAYPGFFSRGGVSTIWVEDRRQREWGSAGGSPLVRGSGGSCNLVQEI